VYSFIGTATRSGLSREAAVGNLEQWAKARLSYVEGGINKAGKKIFTGSSLPLALKGSSCKPLGPRTIMKVLGIRPSSFLNGGKILHP